MTHTSTEQERAEFEAWKEDYALTFEPNYDEHLEADCKAAFLAGMQAARRLQVVPDEVEKLRDELAEETEAAENWRRLALQFDNHRLQAIGHLKAVTNPAACFDKYNAAKAFLSAPPLGGEEVLAQRIAALAAQAKQGAQL